MRKLLLLLCLFSFVLVANSQNLTVEGTAPNLYIAHTVAPKENFYSVGRLYNQAPKSIAAFNNITMEKGLTIGQHVKIPLNAQNFEAGEITNPGETLIPLTHIVGKNETLFRIGNNHNVTPEFIKKWNNLSSDNITPGTALIVGHLRIKSDQGTTNTAGINTPPPVRQPTNIAPAAKPVEEVAVKENAPLRQSAREPNKDEPAVVAKKETVPAVENKEAQKPFETTAPLKDTVAMNEASIVKETAPVKETPVQAPVATTQSPAVGSSTIDLGSLSEGAFAGSFPASATAKSISNKSGEAATFKSISGWQDKKYYVLMNDVTPGTILKVSAPDNKFVYAKVLGSMPEMKENNGLLLRISNAAASHLGIIDPKFPVQISFYQ